MPVLTYFIKFFVYMPSQIPTVKLVDKIISSLKKLLSLSRIFLKYFL